MGQGSKKKKTILDHNTCLASAAGWKAAITRRETRIRNRELTIIIYIIGDLRWKINLSKKYRRYTF